VPKGLAHSGAWPDAAASLVALTGSPPPYLHIGPARSCLKRRAAITQNKAFTRAIPAIILARSTTQWRIMPVHVDIVE